MKRVRYIKIMLTSEEHKKFFALAKALHTDVSELVRQSLHKLADSQQKAA
jgi:hypothetical protein